MSINIKSVTIESATDAIKAHIQRLHDLREQVTTEGKIHSSRFGTPEYDEKKDAYWIGREQNVQAELERAVQMARAAGLLVNEEYKVVG